MEYRIPKRIDKPWGYELLYAHTPAYVGKVIFVKQGYRLSLQYHKMKDETIHVLSGKAWLVTTNQGGELVSNVFETGQSVHLPPGTRHRIEAIEDTVLLEVSTSELDDVVRLEDDYGRADNA